MKNVDRIEHADLVFYLHAGAAFQYFHAGIELGLFELLYKEQSLPQSEIADALNLQQTSTRCLLFGLSALKLIINDDHFYNNCSAVNLLFEKGEWELFRSMIRFQAQIVYVGETDFVESLRECRNIGLERIQGIGNTLYLRLVNNLKLKDVFFEYMEAYSSFANQFLLEHLDLTNDQYVLDVGGGMGKNAVTIALHYSHIHVTVLDLPSVASSAESQINRYKLSDRVKFYSCDIMTDKFPANQDCILFIHLLVIWGQEENRILLKKAYDALNTNGRVIVFSSIANDDEDGPVMAALDSAYFRAVAAGNGLIYPWKDYERLMLDVGFKRVTRIKCNSWTPHGIIIGYKNEL